MEKSKKKTKKGHSMGTPKDLKNFSNSVNDGLKAVVPCSAIDRRQFARFHVNSAA